MKREQVDIALLKAQFEQQQRLLEKQSKRAEQLQLELMLANESISREKQKNEALERQLLQAEQNFEAMLETQFAELTIVKELARLKNENATLKNQYDYILEHSTEQQLTLETALTKLKGNLQIVQIENTEAKKQAVSYQQQLTAAKQQSTDEKQALQQQLQQSQEQVEALAQERFAAQQPLEKDVATRIYNDYTKPHLAVGQGIVLADFLSELTSHLAPDILTELVLEN